MEQALALSLGAAALVAAALALQPKRGRIVAARLSGDARPIQAHLRQFPQLGELPLLVQKGRYAAAV